MYQDYYRLKKEPFHITPDPEFLFLSPSHKQALGSIVYGVQNRKGFVVITGEVGVGKTTIVRSYLERVAKQKTKVIYIFHANVSFSNLLKTIYRELGLDAKTDDPVEMLDGLYEVLMEEFKQGNTVLLIVDEAQNMPIETLEDIRMLSNLETSKTKLLQIVLIGQPEFEKMLNLHELRQLKQRVAIHSIILPFTAKDSLAYIRHRLAKVALLPNAPIFTKSAMEMIVKEAKGIPRTINILCDNAMITGFEYKKKPIDTKIVKEIVADFKKDEKPSFLKFSVWRWVPASFVIAIFIVVLFLVASDKWSLFSKSEHPTLSQTVEIPPVAAKMEPLAKNVDPSRDEQAAPSKEEMKPLEQEMKPSEQEKVREPSRKRFPLSITVKKGNNLFRLTRNVYGYADNKLLAWVKQNNPWIMDMNNIPAGVEIIFPELSEEQRQGNK
jgi:general secretion pathway protein A